MASGIHASGARICSKAAGFGKKIDSGTGSNTATHQE